MNREETTQEDLGGQNSMEEEERKTETNVGQCTGQDSAGKTWAEAKKLKGIE